MDLSFRRQSSTNHGDRVGRHGNENHQDRITNKSHLETVHSQMSMSNRQALGKEEGEMLLNLTNSGN